MKRLRAFMTWALVSLILGVLVIVPAKAQESPITFSLVADKLTYNPGEDIMMELRGYNNTAGDVYCRKGFFDLPFYLMLTIIDPSGMPVQCLYGNKTPEPRNPIRYRGEDWVLGDRIPPPPDPVYQRRIVFYVNRYYPVNSL